MNTGSYMEVLMHYIVSLKLTLSNNSTRSKIKTILKIQQMVVSDVGRD